MSGPDCDRGANTQTRTPATTIWREGEERGKEERRGRRERETREMQNSSVTGRSRMKSAAQSKTSSSTSGSGWKTTWTGGGLAGNRQEKGGRERRESRKSGQEQPENETIRCTVLRIVREFFFPFRKGVFGCGWRESKRKRRERRKWA